MKSYVFSVVCLSPPHPPTGGVIAYISSGSTSSPESCRSGSPCLSTWPAPSRPSLPSRAVGMVVDVPPAAASPQRRGQGVEKTGRSSSSSKSCITSQHKAAQTRPVLLMWPGMLTAGFLCLVPQRSTVWCCCARCVGTWPLASTMASTPAKAARYRRRRPSPVFAPQPE